jgi:hypothetical protein
MAQSTSVDDLTFTYSERLTDKEIRLLEILSPDDNATCGGDLLRLRLIKAPMPTTNAEAAATSFRYLALSYTWGNDEDPKNIIINDAPLTVTINLFQALMHLKSKVTLPVWVDAICINQKDDEEKGNQVRQMNKIYSNAEHTVIWLGEGDSSTGLVLGSLDRVGKEALEAGIWNLSEKDLHNWSTLEADVRTAPIKSRLERLMLATARGSDTGLPFPLASLIDLSFRPWFSRIWILQELSVAKDYMFMCGQQMIPGDHFIAGYFFCAIWIANELRPLSRGGSLFWYPYRIFRIWWRNGWPFMQTLLRRVLDDKPFTLSPRAATTLGTRRKVRRQQGMSLIAHLIRAFTLTSDAAIDASEPKDRIYALLGIASDAEQLAIRPEYRSDIGFQQVYAEVARSLVWNGHLDILTLCRSGYSRKSPYEKTIRDAKLPSWAPDWTKPLARPWGGALEDQLFRASGNTKFTPHRHDEQNLPPNVLTIETRFVETLKEVGSPWTPQWQVGFDYDGARTLFTEIENFLEKSETRYSIKELKEAAWRIPIGDQEFDALGMSQRATQASSRGYNAMKSYVYDQKRNRKINTVVSYLGGMKDMHDSRPFLSDGGYVGLCPDVSLPGDEIHIPLGLHVPLVLRKANDGFYNLVGEAYVHGIMDGEIFDTDSASHVLRII